MSQSSRRSETGNSHSLVTVLGLGIAFLIVLAIVTGRAAEYARLLATFAIALGIMALVGGIPLLALWWAWKHSLPMRATEALTRLHSGQDVRGQLLAGKHRPRVAWFRKTGSYRWEVWWRLRSDMAVSDLNSAKNGEVIRREVGVSSCRFREVLVPARRFPLLRWVPILRRRQFGFVRGTFGTCPIPERLTYAEAYDQPYDQPGRLPWCVGGGSFGRQWVDLAELPHLVSGGESMSGKSYALSQAVMYLAETHPPMPSREQSIAVQFALVDLKEGAMLNSFEPLSHCDRFGMARTPAEAVVVLGAVQAEMQRRYQALRQAGPRIKTIVEYNAWALIRGEQLWPYIVVVVDEAQDCPADELADLTSRGRAAGVHVIVSTQRPDAVTIKARILANSPAVLAFHAATDGNSSVLLGAGQYQAARDIPDPETDASARGLAIWRRGGRPMIRTVYLDPDEAVDRVERLCVGRPAFGEATRQARLKALSVRQPKPIPKAGGGEDELEVALSKDIDRLDAAETWLLLGELDARDTGIGPDGIFDPWRDRERYYLSRKWKLIRRLVRLRSGGRCELQREGCLGVADQVHHENYDHLGFEESDLSELKDACDACHRLVSGKGKVPVETNGRTGRRG